MMLSDLGGGGVVYYTHDAAGQRVRKVWEHSGLVEERIYLGGYEVYRKRDVSGLLVERQSLHVMDGVKRVCLVETKTVDTAEGGSFEVSTVLRFQLGNHLGSAALEVDGEGAVISYEEYHPYGTTAYCSGTGAAEVSRKRYRYTGKEKDEGTGLYYHGARYYACWLGRWTSADPAGLVDGPNLYAYVRGNPIRLKDPNGRQTVDEQIAQMTDVQLHRHVAGLSGEKRAAFARSATGMAAQRAWGTINRGGMEIGYSLSTDSITGTAPKNAPSHKAQSTVTAERSPCPTCHGEYGAPLPRASVGDDPVLVAYGAAALTVGTMMGEDSGTGPSANARRATVAAFDENPNSTSADAEELPTRVNPTAEAVLNVVAVKAPGGLAKSVGRGLKADAALGRASGTNIARRGAFTSGSTGPAFDPVKLARIQTNLEKRGVIFVTGEEGGRMARALGGEAAYLAMEGGRPGVVVLGPNPSRAAVVEELLHLGQHRSTGWSSTFGSQVTRFEIEAQHMLLDIGAKLGWSEAELAQISRALDQWSGK
jgi:RHS repeat-associated protein